MSQEYLNFKEISQNVRFKELLNHLNIPYSDSQKGELKGDGFVVTISKNLYFNPHGDDKGSVINFLANLRCVSLREAAKELKDAFLNENEKISKDQAIPDLELEYHKVLSDLAISEELAQEYEIGYVSKRSIMAGKIAFKCYDENGVHIGFVGWKFKENGWFFPKGFERPLYNLNRVEKGGNIVVTNDLLDTLYLLSKGEKQVVCLMGNSMTSKQGELVANNFHSVQLVHPNPEYIIQELSKSVFVKQADLNEMCPLN